MPMPQYMQQKIITAVLWQNSVVDVATERSYEIMAQYCGIEIKVISKCFVVNCHRALELEFDRFISSDCTWTATFSARMSFIDRACSWRSDYACFSIRWTYLRNYSIDGACHKDTGALFQWNGWLVAREILATGLIIWFVRHNWTFHGFM